jgi:hypothetical protein
MRNLSFTAWTVCLCLTTITAGAQQAPHKEAVQFAVTERVSRVEARPPGIRFGLHKPREFGLAPLSESEFARFTEPSTRLKIGIERALPPEALSAGAWEATTEGSRVWRMTLRSPGSRGLRVEFRNFSVGSGNVWLHDGSQYDGPYTGKGRYDNGQFWSGNLLSESVILEYVPAPDAPADGLPPFEIHTISHQVRGLLGASDILPGGPDAGVVNTADYCELDPNCYSDWRGTMSTVGQIIYQDGGNSFLCSGSLLGTRDNSFKPYFLTAGHCINNEAAARTIQAYWTYQTASCAGSPPASRDTSAKSTAGGHLIASGAIEQGDYSLVLLPDVPSGVTFSGWDTSDPPNGTALTGIHHPSGSWKRISFGERIADSSNAIGNGSGGASVAPSNLFLQVLWERGRVEHGSSGSPLFSGPGVVVGSLSYGPVATDGSVCSINPSVAGYSRFSNTYSQVSDYLENLPAAEVKPDKASLNFTIANHVPAAGQVVQLTTQSASQATFKLRADASWIRLSAMTGTITAKTGAAITITADATQLDQPGQYTSTVTILSGAAPPVFVNVTATVRLDQSNVIPAITPNPVVQSGGQWSFQIRLQETAGSATRLTGIKVNGTDYSTSVNDWFGTNHIAANGAIAAPLHGTGVFPAGDQYFEFWGIDDGSNLPWYRVTTVTFR